MAYNVQYGGASVGVEAVPHLHFWKELPTVRLGEKALDIVNQTPQHALLLPTRGSSSQNNALFPLQEQNQTPENHA
jgi:hypothetical protein